MFSQADLNLLIGKKIEGLIYAYDENKKEPKHLYLFFDDGTHYEFYTYETHIVGTWIGGGDINEYRKKWESVDSMKYEFYPKEGMPIKKMKVQYLADAMFADLIADSEYVMEKFIENTTSVSTLNHIKLAQQRIYIYLIAGNAIVLTNACPNDQITKVICIFKEKALEMLFDRWQIEHEKGDELINMAADNLMKLLYTDPNIEKALSFEWAKTWFSYVGISETNPDILHNFSEVWKKHFIKFTKYLNAITVVE